MLDIDTKVLEQQIEETSQQIQEYQSELIKLQDIRIRLVSRIEFIELNNNLLADNKKVLFTKAEIMKKFKTGSSTFNEIKKIGHLEPIDNLGRAPLYNISDYEQAREDYKLWKKKYNKQFTKGCEKHGESKY